ncbi:MAG: hypothetical protein KDK41_17330 [Leptospiraceae bacterium]|nr:hypothetical protein [Leptospiraceae bacterium]
MTIIFTVLNYFYDLQKLSFYSVLFGISFFLVNFPLFVISAFISCFRLFLLMPVLSAVLMYLLIEFGKRQDLLRWQLLLNVSSIHEFQKTEPASIQDILNTVSNFAFPKVKIKYENILIGPGYKKGAIFLDSLSLSATNSNGLYRRSAFIFHSKNKFPELTIEPKFFTTRISKLFSSGFGLQEIKVHSNNDFQKLYRICGNDEKEVNKIFNKDITRQFVNRRYFIPSTKPSITHSQNFPNMIFCEGLILILSPEQRIEPADFSNFYQRALEIYQIFQ